MQYILYLCVVVMVYVLGCTLDENRELRDANARLNTPGAMACAYPDTPANPSFFLAHGVEVSTTTGFE